MDKITKISDAIAQGAKASAQCFGTLCNEEGHTCALGSALVGIGFEFNDDFNKFREGEEELQARWPKLYEPAQIGCPVKDCSCGPLDTGPKTAWSRNMAWLITHLNDHHVWSREQIASWLFERGL